MPRYLIVANQTVSSELVDRLREIVHYDDPLILVVPATPAQDLLTWEDGGYERAQRVAVEASGLLRAGGLNLEDAVVGDADPMRAIANEIESGQHRYDHVIVCTLPLGVSRWLRQNLVRQTERRFGLPVTHVVVHRHTSAEPEPASFRRSNVRDGDGWALRDLGEWRGRPLVTSDGHRLTHLSEILYDPVTERPLWVAATMSIADVSPTLIPVNAVKIEGDHLRVSYDWDFLKHQPAVLIGAGFSSSTEEEALYEYFELPYNAALDLRVLREGQEYPDSLSYPGAA